MNYELLELQKQIEDLLASYLDKQKKITSNPDTESLVRGEFRDLFNTLIDKHTPKYALSLSLASLFIQYAKQQKKIRVNITPAEITEDILNNLETIINEVKINKAKGYNEEEILYSIISSAGNLSSLE